MLWLHTIIRAGKAQCKKWLWNPIWPTKPGLPDRQALHR